MRLPAAMFAAMQAAQKIVEGFVMVVTGFAAMQAAQKIEQSRMLRYQMFAAMQAAQKCSGSHRQYRPGVRRHAGGSEDRRRSLLRHLHVRRHAGGSEDAVYSSR